MSDEKKPEPVKKWLGKPPDEPPRRSSFEEVKAKPPPEPKPKKE